MKFKVTTIIETSTDDDAWSISAHVERLLSILFKVKSCVSEPLPEEPAAKEKLPF